MAVVPVAREPLDKEIRIILVGRTGAGKSATGNTIFGEKIFKSRASSNSVTQDCENASKTRFGKRLQIVDAPGFRDKKTSKEVIMNKVAQWVVHLSPGIHAILFVIRIGRFTEEDVKTAEDFIETFGSSSRNYVIAVFTGADDLDEEFNLGIYVEEADDDLKKYLQSINNRYIAVNNKARFEENNNFVETLLAKIEQMQGENQGRFYSCEMFEKAEKEMKIIEAKKLGDIEKRNREHDEKMIGEAMAKYKAQLEKERVNEKNMEALISKKLATLNDDIAERNRYEARVETRKEVSAGLVSFVATVGIGAAIGSAVGPIGLGVGALIGAACYGIRAGYSLLRE